MLQLGYWEQNGNSSISINNIPIKVATLLISPETFSCGTVKESPFDVLFRLSFGVVVVVMLLSKIGTNELFLCITEIVDGPNVDLADTTAS